MKSFFSIFLSVLMGAMVLIGCEKADDLPFYKEGVAPTVTASTNTIAPVPADSLAVGLELSWSDPGYAADSSTYKYVVQIDEAGKNFATATEWVVNGNRSFSLLNKEINNMLLDRGFEFGVPYDMELRVLSSYANNNEQRISNTVPVRMTPYKVPPRVELPASGRLFLVGSATQGDWNNPVPEPAQEFARIDETTFAGVFDLKGGAEYLVLPVNGSWDTKYSVANKNLGGLAEGGDFGFNLNDNFPGPEAAGLYLITLDFQSGKFSVTPFALSELPSDLFIVGSATAGDWNPVPVPSQQFTRLNSSEWEITVDLFGGREYLILPENGNWDKKYSVQDNSLPGLADGGTFGFNLPANIPGPAEDGQYRINVNFANLRYKVTRL
jgi:hypothetical protein